MSVFKGIIKHLFLAANQLNLLNKRQMAIVEDEIKADGKDLTKIIISGVNGVLHEFVTSTNTTTFDDGVWIAVRTFDELKFALENVFCPKIRIMERIELSSTETIEIHAPYSTYAENLASGDSNFNAPIIIEGQDFEITACYLTLNFAFREVPDIIFENKIYVTDTGFLIANELLQTSGANSIIYFKNITISTLSGLSQADSEDRVFIKSVQNSGTIGSGIRVQAKFNDTVCNYNNIYGINNTEIPFNLAILTSSYEKIIFESNYVIKCFATTSESLFCNCYIDTSFNIRYLNNGYATIQYIYWDGTLARRLVTYTTGTAGNIVSGAVTKESLTRT